MGIMIMSDVVPPDTIDNPFAEGNIEELVDEKLLRMLYGADLNIINLECPLTKEGKKIPKWGSYLKARPENVRLLQRIPNILVNLANNHIKDYGNEGVLNTISLLDENKIAYVGAGINKKDMKKYSLHTIQNKKVAVFSCTEHEFSHAGRNEAGANPIEEGEDIFTIQHLAAENDYVIILYHGGREFYPYPTPCQQKRLRNYVRAGADIVVCQHSHCIGSVEYMEQGTIIYGQGGFLFAERPEITGSIQDRSMWKQGMVVSIDLICPNIKNIFYTDKAGRLVVKENDTEEQELKNRSENLLEEDFVEKAWQDYCREHSEYMEILELWNTPPNTFGKKIKYICKMLINRKRDPKEYLKVYNYLFCESHEELIKENCRSSMLSKNVMWEEE